VIAVIDNYDSFTYNLVQYLYEWESSIRVFRNDRITVGQLVRMKPDYLVISPGPGTPDDGGISLDAIGAFAGRVPILGVCLGHQCIVQHFGGRVVRAGRLMHGKVSQIRHDGKTIFKNIADPFTATRYHSLIAEPESLPPCLEVSARTDSCEIMGVRHRKLAVEGVQFHPESILTEAGEKILKNFLDLK
jgi:anthranilate synthase/aminodeoxychorismate synthase-like glutamine amidotransferase